MLQHYVHCITSRHYLTNFLSHSLARLRLDQLALFMPALLLFIPDIYLYLVRYTRTYVPLSLLYYDCERCHVM